MPKERTARADAPTVIWNLACKSWVTRARERVDEKWQAFFTRLGMTRAQIQAVVDKDRTYILKSAIAPSHQLAGRYDRPDRLWQDGSGGWLISPPSKASQTFLRSLGGLYVRLKDGRTYFIMRAALPVDDPYELTRIVYRLARRDDVAFIDLPRGAAYERDATVIRTSSELYTLINSPEGIPRSPTMPSLILPQHMLRELEEFANVQLDYLRKQFMNLEYLFNVQATRMAARLKHQLEAELTNIKNKLRQYEAEAQNTLRQAKATAQVAGTSDEYVRQLEQYVASAKQKLQAEVERLSQEIRELTQRLMEAASETVQIGAPPEPPYRPDQWRQPTGAAGFGRLVSDPKVMVLGLGGIAALAWFMRRR